MKKIFFVLFCAIGLSFLAHPSFALMCLDEVCWDGRTDDYPCAGPLPECVKMPAPYPSTLFVNPGTGNWVLTDIKDDFKCFCQKHNLELSEVNVIPDVDGGLVAIEFACQNDKPNYFFVFYDYEENAPSILIPRCSYF